MKKAIKTFFFFALSLSLSMTAFAEYDARKFFELCNQGSIEELRTAIEAGADVNATVNNNDTPIMAAIMGRNAGALRFLIENGADAQYTNPDSGINLLWLPFTPFQVNPEPMEVMQILIAAGANVNSIEKRSGRSLLMGPILLRHSKAAEITEMLLDAGADVKIKGNDGKTALDHAKENKVLDGTQALKRLEEMTNS